MRTEPSFSRTGLTWAANSGIFVFGVVLAILGALLPLLFLSIELDPSQAGSLFWFLNLGALLITVSSGPVFDRFGFKLILILASVIVAGALWGIAFGSAYPTLALCSFLLGLGGGGLNSGTNVLIADLYRQRQAAALNRLGVFFGFGACFIPLFIGTLITVVTLRTILFLTGLIALVPGLAFLLQAFPPAKHAAAGLPLKEVRTLLTHPVVLLMGVLLFFQSGNEFSTSGWVTTFLVDKLDISPGTASFYLSGFWAAVIVGRLVSVRLLRVVTEATLVQVSALSAACALATFILFPHRLVSVFTVIWVGFSMASIFPSVLGQAAHRFPHLSGTVFGILIGIALMGGMTVPWLAGYVVEKSSLSAALFLPVVGFLAVMTLQTAVKRRHPV